MYDKKVAINNEIYDFIVEEARRERRTIQGQTEILLEMAWRQVERRKEIENGDTQIDPAAITSRAR